MKIRGFHKPITPEEKETILTLLETGMEQKQVAGKLGRSTYFVWKINQERLAARGSNYFNVEEYSKVFAI